MFYGPMNVSECVRAVADITRAPNPRFGRPIRDFEVSGRLCSGKMMSYEPREPSVDRLSVKKHRSGAPNDVSDGIEW